MKQICFLLVLLPFLCCCGAKAEEPDPYARALASLTEVYSYTAEEAQAFVFEPYGEYAVSYHDPLHPEWTYVVQPDLKYGGLEDLSPFSGPQCGEGAVRTVLREAQDKGWFRRWGKMSRQALLESMNAQGISPTPELETETVSAARAVHLFFVSAYGDSFLWRPAVRQWRNAVLEQNALSAEDVAEYPAGSSDGAAFLQAILPDPDYIDANIIYFEGLPPLALREALRDSRLQGWRLISGSLTESKVRMDANHAAALMLFEKGGDRLLIMAVQDTPKGSWTLTRVDEGCLLPGRTPRILHQRSSYRFGRAFAICYTDPGQPSFTLLVDPYQPHESATPLCPLSACVMYDEKSQTGWRWEADVLTEYPANGVPRETRGVAALPYCLDQVDGGAFPATADEVLAYANVPVPEGYGVVSSSVHLRAQTSTRSGDLGVFNAGTLVQVEAALPGDPRPWYQVRCGRIGGYVVGDYIAYAPRGAAPLPLQSCVPLPVARAAQDTYLRRDTGLLSPSVIDLPKGSEMHVLLETGGWLYVAVPRGDMSWYMDVKGIYGFVRAGEVTQYASLPALQWDAQKK